MTRISITPCESLHLQTSAESQQDQKTNLNFYSTSPSVYAIWTKINGWNTCNNATTAPLGPTLTSIIQPFDITDLRSSLYYGSTTSTVSGKISTVYVWEQLHLTDLYIDCPTTQVPLFGAPAIEAPAKPLAGGLAGQNTFAPVPSAYRCNPYLAIPLIVTEMGYPWWRECPILGGFAGMPDPPYALTLGTEAPLFTSVATQPLKSVDPAGTPSPNLATSTSAVQSAVVVQSSAPSALADNASPQTSTSNNIATQVGVVPAQNTQITSPNSVPAPAGAAPAQNTQVTSPNSVPAQAGALSAQNSQPANDPSPVGDSGVKSDQAPAVTQQPGQLQPVSAVSVAVIGTNVISAVLSSGNGNNPTPTAAAVILPGGLTLLPGNVATVPAQDGRESLVVISAVAGSGNAVQNLVISTVGSPSASTVPVNVAAAAGGIILPGGSTLLPGAVATIAASDGSGKSVVISAATAAGTSNSIQNLVISTVGSPSATTISVKDALIQGNVATSAINGPVTTLAGLGAVVSFDSSGAIIQFPASIAVPGAPSNVQASITGTLSIGGPAETIPGSNVVVSLGSSGVVLQYPGGAVSTIPAPKKAATSLSGATGSPGIAGFIYQIINGEIMSATTTGSSSGSSGKTNVAGVTGTLTASLQVPSTAHSGSGSRSSSVSSRSFSTSTSEIGKITQASSAVSAGTRSGAVCIFALLSLLAGAM